MSLLDLLKIQGLFPLREIACIMSLKSIDFSKCIWVSVSDTAFFVLDRVLIKYIFR